jgi:hypothetical protein
MPGHLLAAEVGHFVLNNWHTIYVYHLQFLPRTNKMKCRSIIYSLVFDLCIDNDKVINSLAFLQSRMPEIYLSTPLLPQRQEMVIRLALICHQISCASGHRRNHDDPGFCPLFEGIHAG